MKFIAFLVISASLCLGLVSAVTAYLPSLDLSDQDLDGLTLNAPAGVVVIRPDDQDLIDAARRQAMAERDAGNAEGPSDDFKAQLVEDGALRRQWTYDAALGMFRTALAAGPDLVEGEDYRVGPDDETNILTRWAVVGVGLDGTGDAEGGAPAEKVLVVVQSSVPLVPPNTSLSPEVLSVIRSNLESPGVSLSDDPSTYRVRVKEFSFGRWDGRWLFLASCVGLLVGAFIIRAAASAAVARATQNTAPGESPLQALHRAHDEVADLRKRVSSMNTPTRWDEARDIIVADLDRINRTHLEAFVNARPQLVAALGMGGYAQLMDAFAAAERQLNRAWSAAADEVLEESFICLDRGGLLLEEAVKFLPPGSATTDG